MSSVKLQTAATLVGVFVLGGVCGAGLYRIVADEARPSPPQTAGPFGPAPVAGLDLTEEQERQAREIGDTYRPEIEAIRREVAPRLRAIHEKMRSELDEILTPRQRRLKNERDAERVRRERRPPPHR